MLSISIRTNKRQLKERNAVKPATYHALFSYGSRAYAYVASVNQALGFALPAG